MSSTTGIQNLLVNVFRPVYRYDTTTTLFTPKLELSNIDTYSGNVVQATRADFGDSAGNMYVGSNAGNDIATLRACVSNTALGVFAGNLISNVSNSTYVGYNAGGGVAGDPLNPITAVIGIGTNAGGAGQSNIFIGNSTKGTGSNNILIGHGIDTGTSNYRFRIGNTIYGDLSKNWIGIGRPTPYEPVNNRLDVSGNTYIYGQLGINITPGTRTLDVNGDFRSQDAAGNKVDFTGGKVGVNRDPQSTMDISGTFRVQSNATTLLDVSTSAVTAPGGFASVRGSVAMAGSGSDSQTLGSIKIGMIAVSARDSSNSSNYASALYMSTTTSSVDQLSTGGSNGLTLGTSGTSLTVNSTSIIPTTVAYSITYFPLP